MPSLPASPVSAHPLIQRLRALGLPPEDFAVHGSGPMLAAGLRSAIGDLDVVARGDAWGKAVRIGEVGHSKIKGSPVVYFWGGRIEIFSSWLTDADDVDSMVDEANVVDGVRFVRLERVLHYKKLLSRAKDIPDIHAIEAYIHAHGNTA